MKKAFGYGRGENNPRTHFLGCIGIKLRSALGRILYSINEQVQLPWLPDLRSRYGSWMRLAEKALGAP